MIKSPDFEEFLALLSAHDVRYLGRDDLILNKQAAGRPKDIADLEYLLR